MFLTLISLNVRSGRKIISKLMANIVIVTALYPPEPVISSEVSYAVANYIASRGHQVTVLRPQPTRPMGIVFNQETPEQLNAAASTNVRVIQLTSFTSPESGLLGRMKESYSFGKESSTYIKNNLAGCDVVYANTWPLFGQYLLGATLKKLRIPFVLHIQDIYPESWFEKLPDWLVSLLAPPLIRVDRKIAGFAEKLVVVSKNMLAFYRDRRGVPVEKLMLVQNFHDESAFLENTFVEKVANSRPFTFMFLGNIGPVAGVELLIKSFQEAQIPNSQLIIAGGGSAKTRCELLAKEWKSIHFESVPAHKAAVPQTLSKADVLLLPAKKNAAMSSIPSKLISYLFSAKPILATLDLVSDTSRAILDSNCGWVGEPEDAEWLTKKMREVSKMDKTVLREMGQGGFAYGIQNFSKRKGSQLLGDTIIELTGTHEK